MLERGQCYISCLLYGLARFKYQLLQKTIQAEMHLILDNHPTKLGEYHCQTQLDTYERMNNIKWFMDFSRESKFENFTCMQRYHTPTIYVHLCIFLYLFHYMTVCMDVCVCIYVCMYACMYLSMYIGIYVCMHICIHTYIVCNIAELS